MIKNTERLQTLVKQANSLHIVNTVYFAGLLVLLIFTFYLQNAVADLSFDSTPMELKVIAFAAVFFLLGKYAYQFQVLKLSKWVADHEFELLCFAYNLVLSIALVSFIEEKRLSPDLSLLLLSFLPTLLFLIALPLTWFKQGKVYHGFMGMVEWGSLLITLGWGGWSFYLMYKADLYLPLCSNLLVMLSPHLLHHIQRRHASLLSERLEKEIYRDGLTGLPNRKYYYDQYDCYRERNKQSYRDGCDGIAVVYIDIDFFKQYNDAYGHGAGDECLIKVGMELQRLASELGMQVCRLGGEEFLLYASVNLSVWHEDFFNNSTIQAWQDRDYWMNDLPHARSPESFVTLSAGVAFVPNRDIYSSNAAGVTKMADELLYKAKSEGRACIVVSEQLKYLKKEQEPNAGNVTKLVMDNVG